MNLVITISPKRLRSLLLAERKLIALEAGGVDNWDGYYDSLSDCGYLTFEAELDDKDLHEHLGDD